MALAAPVSRKGPTTSTLRLIEQVMRKAAIPLSRYQIRQALGNRVAQPTLDDALDYLADHDLVYDEGPGGKAVWIHASAATHAKLE